LAELVTDPAGVIRNVTPAAAALLRAEPGFLRGAPLRSLVRRDDVPRLTVLLAAEASRDGASVQLAVPGGRSVSAELTVTAARDDRGFVTGLRWRVRERRRGARLRESEGAVALRHRLERLIADGHGVCLIGADGVVSWAGTAALRVMGRGYDEVVGGSWPVDLAMRRGREGSGAFPTFTRGDGSVTALDYVVAPLIEDDGVVGVALVFTEAEPGA
jgi:PAS domain-containing protein